MRLRHVLILAAALAVAAATGASAARADTPRTVYLSGIDAKGDPVTDLTAADLVVKEDGKDRAIAELKIATTPMDIVFMVDDSGSGVFQASALTVLQTFLEHAKISIMQFVPQAVKLTEFTDDVKLIQEALNKLGPRGKVDHDGEQVNEAIGEAARVLRQRKAARPVIIIFTIGGAGGNVRNANFIMDELRDSGAMLNVLYVSNSDVGMIIGDGPRHSGGRIEQATGVNALPGAVKKLIDTISTQYVLTYTLPDGVKPSERLNVSTTRKGVKLFAPARIPVK